MDCQNYITESAERKKGQHLQREERGAIQYLKRQGYSNRASPVFTVRVSNLHFQFASFLISISKDFAMETSTFSAAFRSREVNPLSFSIDLVLR